MIALQKLFETLSRSLDESMLQLSSHVNALNSALASLGSLSKSASELEQLVPQCERWSKDLPSLQKQVCELSAKVQALASPPPSAPVPREAASSVHRSTHPDSLRQLVLEMDSEIRPLLRRIEALEATLPRVKPVQK